MQTLTIFHRSGIFILVNRSVKVGKSKNVAWECPWWLSECIRYSAKKKLKSNDRIKAVKSSDHWTSVVKFFLNFCVLGPCFGCVFFRNNNPSLKENCNSKDQILNHQNEMKYIAT